MSSAPPPFWETLIERCIAENLTDLHLSVGTPPHGRINKTLQRLMDKNLTEEEMEALCAHLLNGEQKEIFRGDRSVDLAYHRGEDRFRLNLYYERGHPALALRHLQRKIPALADLNLPPEIASISTFPYGLVIVTGATGSGKSTTLAALLREMNLHRNGHVITIEEPIEYVHENGNCLFHQREVGVDARSFASALREGLREDPDVILVGEIRDLDTARAALTAAETGHLVLSTLHSGDALGALDRLVALFPSDEQPVVHRQLALVLQAVLAQRLVEGKTGMVPIIEFLRSSYAVRNLIRTGNFVQIASFLETGKGEGMVTESQSLLWLLERRLIDSNKALEHSRNPETLRSQMRARQGKL